jgi:branched-chain amino acid transport system ATP-binding protein
MTMLAEQDRITGSHLEVEGLRAGYGGVDALSGVDLTLEAGKVTAVIGPNGAGKSTLLKCLTGMIKPRAGTVHLNGKRIDRLSSGRIASMGVCQVPEGRRLFSTQTIADNLMVAAWVQRPSRKRLAADCEAVYERFPILGERRKEFAASLSGGEAQMLAIGMALMARPSVLLLDEPSLGLAPLLVTRILDVVRELVNDGVTVLLVEQMVHKALSIADSAYVLSHGRVVLSGPAKDLVNQDAVKEVYLGSS